MSNLKFEDLPKATERILDKLCHLEEQLKNIEENFKPKEPEQLMTRQEAATYFKISLSTLWHWTNKKKLIGYGVGNRVYYKRSELVSRLVQIN